MSPTPGLDPSQPVLWGLTVAEIMATVPAAIEWSLAVTVVFAAVAVFGRRWRMGLSILAAGMLVVAVPIAVVGLGTDGTLPQIMTAILSIWLDSFGRFALFVVPLAWLARLVWNDLGLAFEAILDRWGTRGVVLSIALFLTAYAAILVARHS